MNPVRALRQGQRCRVRVFDVDTLTATTVHETTRRLYEAPNWTPDDHLLVNGDGALWRLPVTGGEPRHVPLREVPPINNDHVLGHDGRTAYVSANDWRVYSASFDDGTTQALTAESGAAFLHGISPDGSRLAYVAIRDDENGRRTGPHVRTIAIDGSDDRAVTAADNVDDGCEYSPDGEWIYFNTERFSSSAGHAQVARVRIDGSSLEQLTRDDRVNWFPHPSPTRGRFVYLSYPPGTQGHPADLLVQLRLVEGDHWDLSTVLAETIGGQGTVNVGSWSPDGARFAFVDYPFAPRRR